MKTAELKQENNTIDLSDEQILKVRENIMKHEIFATHQGETVEVTPDNVSKIYNANYIASFLERIENAISDDAFISPDDYKKAEVVYQYKIDVLERQSERIVQREQKEIDKAAEKERKEKEAAEQQGIRESIVHNTDPEFVEMKEVGDSIDDDDYEPLVVDHSTKKNPVEEPSSTKSSKKTPAKRARKTTTKKATSK